jgi:hypothetical protein
MLKHIAKLTGFSVIVWLMYKQLSGGKGIEAIITLYQSEQDGLQYQYLVGCIFLMPLNWLLESQKWRVLHQGEAKITFLKSLKTILAGTSLAVITPAGIGDVGGRMVVSHASKRAHAFSATLVSSIAQNFCNLAAGLSLGWIFMETVFHITFSDYRWYAGLFILQSVVFLFFYYNVGKAERWFQALFGKSKWQRAVASVCENLSSFSYNQLHKVLGLSLLRYLVYFTQYLWILLFLRVDRDMTEICGNIAGIYLIQSGIPLPPFASVLARGELAILVWSQSGIEAVIALTATFSLWIINLMIPAIVGLFVLYQAGKSAREEQTKVTQ